MKSTFITCLLLFLFTEVFAQKTDFSGSWELNLEKSDFGVAPTFVAHQKIYVRQTNDSISLNGTGTDQNGNKYSGAANYSLDGKTQEKMMQSAKLVGSFKWSADQRNLLKEQLYVDPSQSIEPFRQINEVWSLSEDGQSMVIEQTVKQNIGKGYSVRVVYDKK